MVKTDAAAPSLQYRAMDRAMEEQGVTDATREKVRELMKDPEVVALYHLKKNSIGMCSNWKQIEYSFFEAVADVAGDPAVDVKEKLRKEAVNFWRMKDVRQPHPPYPVFWGLANFRQGLIPGRETVDF